MSTEDQILKRLLLAFHTEAEEHINAISSYLVELENDHSEETATSFIESAMREMHSLKGAARMVNLTHFETVCQNMETVLSSVKRREARLSPELLDTMHESANLLMSILSSETWKETSPHQNAVALIVEKLSGLIDVSASRTPLNAVSSDQTEPVASMLARPIAAFRYEAAQAESGERSEPVPPVQFNADTSVPSETAITPQPETGTPIQSTTGGAIQSKSGPAARPEPAHAGDQRKSGEYKSIGADGLPSATGKSQMESLKISATKLDRLFRQAEEMLTFKLFAHQRLSDIAGLADKAELWEKEWSKIRPEIRSWRQENEIDGSVTHSAARVLDFLEWSHNSVKSMQNTLSSLRKAAEHDVRFVSTSTDTLLEDAKELLMLPSSTLLEMLPKLVRDLSRAQGKEIELILQGVEIDLDKRVLEEIKAPLIHLVRNCIDHGIETPEFRALKNKPRKGHITVSFSRVEGNMVELAILDDGAGIDVEQVKQAAVRTGIASQEEVDELDQQSAIALIFRSTLSTSPIITEISGRGLGMAIVREKVEELNGRITVESTPGLGSSFRLLLPVALSTFRGLIVKTAGQQFIIPVANVESVIRFKVEDVKTVENRETIPFRGRPASLVDLADVLELQQRARPSEREAFKQAVIVSAKQKHVAFEVDEVISVQEVLVKSMQHPLVRVRNVAAAAILGSGKVVPVLNAHDLILSAARTRSARKAATADQATAASYSILVVDDSITARTAIRDILELAGYNVKTAVDGVDGWTELKSSHYDLMVCDVDMPRMSGFDLTAKIRSDGKLGSLPVVLLTALASREDRERGIDVGANAYIVKSSFDQSNLLDVIKRLI